MANAYFFDSGVLTLEETSSSTDFAPIGLQDVTVTPAFEHEELFTADSTFREDVKRHTHSVNVEISYSKLPLEFAQQWLGGSGGTTATASQDDESVALFNATLVSTSADGSVERTLEVTEIHFAEFEVLNGSQGEYEEYSLSGSGRTVGQLEDTSGA
jgi:hypothetical protein